MKQNDRNYVGWTPTHTRAHVHIVRLVKHCTSHSDDKNKTITGHDTCKFDQNGTLEAHKIHNVVHSNLYACPLSFAQSLSLSFSLAFHSLR